MSTPGAEIERKFLVDDVPERLDRGQSEVVTQGYVAIDDGVEVRVRRRGDHFSLTVKQGGGRSRLEEELEIDADRFERLWQLTEGRRIAKTRYVVPAPDGAEIEVDVYADDLDGLVTAEVEFPSEGSAEAFEPPSWFGREVTDDDRYKNRSLACHGLPS
jgi:CYTH domain-containing protein